jgi:hypothetical protein
VLALLQLRTEKSHPRQILYLTAVPLSDLRGGVLPSHWFLHLPTGAVWRGYLYRFKSLATLSISSAVWMARELTS